MAANRICFDIETVGPNDPEVIAMIKESLLDGDPPTTVARNSSAERVLARANRLEFYRDMTKGKGEWLENNWSTTLLDARLEQAIADAAVDTLLARPIVTCVAIDDEAPITMSTRTGDEVAMLAEFARFYDDVAGPDSFAIGHNNRGFDIPVLTTRFRRFEIDPPRHWPRWSNGRVFGNVYDTMQESASNKPFVRAQKAAIAHGLGGFKLTKWGDRVMDGSLVAEAHAAGAWDVLEEYCMSDVLASRVLGKRLTHGWKYLSSRGTPETAADSSLRGELLRISCDEPNHQARLTMLGNALAARKIIQPSEVAALSA